MLRLRPILRCVPATSVALVSASFATDPMKVDKAALKHLRSRTGYSYVNCRKALLQFGNDRLEEAEKWLKDMAEKEGWNKAAKLKKRQTKQGLVSAIADGNRAALAEIYCETDFVARSSRFKQLVEKVTLGSLKAAQGFDPLPGEKTSIVFKDFDSLELVDGTLASDSLREAINELGENMIVPPVTLILSQPDVSLWGYAHPPGSGGGVYMGTFASVVALEKEREVGFPIETLGRQLCQQIIGMKAETVGLPPEPDTSPSKTEDGGSRNPASQEEDEEIHVTQVDEKETSLLRQSFILNPTQTVYDYVSQHGIKVVNFYRAEIGEKYETKRE